MISTRRVRFVSIDFPLAIHTDAESMAETARCAGDQGKFWQMYESILSGDVIPEKLIDISSRFGLDGETFRRCKESRKYKATIINEVKLAFAIKVSGTPTFVIGMSTATGVTGNIVVGARPYDEMESLVRRVEQKTSKSSDRFRENR